METIERKIEELIPAEWDLQQMTDEQLRHLTDNMKQYELRYKDIIWTCAECGKEFKCNSAYRSRLPVYCSRECAGARLREYKTCQYCGRRFNKYQNRLYCSNECKFNAVRGQKLSDQHRRALSRAKKGRPIKHLLENKEAVGAKISEGLKRYWATVERPPVEPNKHVTHWRKLRKALIREAGACQRCGERGRLHVHHIVPYAIAGKHEIGNLVVLCPSCHRYTESQNKHIYNILQDWDITALAYRLAMEDAGKGIYYEVEN